MPRTKNHVRWWTKEEDQLLEHFVSQQGKTSHLRPSLPYSLKLALLPASRLLTTRFWHFRGG